MDSRTDISAGRSIVWVVLADRRRPPDRLPARAAHAARAAFSNTASDQTEINNILALDPDARSALGVITFFVYALAVVPPAGRPARRTARRSGATRRMQMGWVGVTTTIVIVLAIVGTIELLQAPNSQAGAGAGGGQGADADLAARAATRCRCR